MAFEWCDVINQDELNFVLVGQFVGEGKGWARSDVPTNKRRVALDVQRAHAQISSPRLLSCKGVELCSQLIGDV